MIEMNLKNKNVLITGGSMGIGLCLAQKLLEEGSNVMVCARNKSVLDEVKKENSNLEVVQCDITVVSDVNHLKSQFRKLFGEIDILINNAALFRHFKIQESYPVEEQLQEINVNFGGTVLVTNVFLSSLLLSKESLIVNITSGFGYIPGASAPIYSATKAAINSWTWSLRHQLKDTNCSVVLLSPNLVDTRMNMNNPFSADMKKKSPSEFAEFSVKGFKKSKTEILDKPINYLKYISRYAPNFAFKMINKERD